MDRKNVKYTNVLYDVLVDNESGHPKHVYLNRKQLGKIENNKNKTCKKNTQNKQNDIVAEYKTFKALEDGRVICMCAIVRNIHEYVTTAFKDKSDHTMKGSVDFYHTMNVKKKALYIGHAICHKEDMFDEEVGYALALRRAKKKPMCCLESKFTGEFNTKMVLGIMALKMMYIRDNIDNWVKKEDVELDIEL